LFAAFSIVTISLAGTYFFVAKLWSPLHFISQQSSKENQTQGTKHGPCLADNEVADYIIDEKYAKEIKIPSVPTQILIKDKTSTQTNYSFTIDNFLPLLRVQKCGIYFVREFNVGAPNYRSELWRYDYAGKGSKLFVLSSFEDGKPKAITYSSAFVIDAQEKYVGFERSYLGQQDYAFVLKDLKTFKDLFVLTSNDIHLINPKVTLGIIGLGKWSNDSKYLWGTVFDGALDTAYIWIETTTWKTEVYSPPADLPSGAERATSFAGYVAYADFPTFFGIDIIAQQEQEKFKKEGRVKHLYLYNLRTKEKQLLATTTDPVQRFNIKWLSDTELQYTFPSGETKIYTVSTSTVQ